MICDDCVHYHWYEITDGLTAPDCEYNDEPEWDDDEEAETCERFKPYDEEEEIEARERFKRRGANDD